MPAVFMNGFHPDTIEKSNVSNQYWPLRDVLYPAGYFGQYGTIQALLDQLILANPIH